ncbi:hypothetical protein [Micromonospora sp. NPDC005367]|uniref:hypothetical protein n=1 Tax=Micromonospora sp. NPDC005367 TaxID=3155590 RepID=UPI0033B13713
MNAMTDLGFSREEFEQTLQRIERLLGKVEQLSNSIVQRCNRAAQLLPAFAMGGLQESLDKFTAIVKAFFAVMREQMLSPGWPPALYGTGDDWTNRVGAVASSLSGMAGSDQTTVNEKWEGAGATAYAEALSAQGKALSAIKAATDEIDDALFKLCAALVAFWVMIAVAIATYVVELTAAAAATSTGVGAPAGAAVLVRARQPARTNASAKTCTPGAWGRRP